LFGQPTSADRTKQHDRQKLLIPRDCPERQAAIRIVRGGKEFLNRQGYG
jgi:hypothetical protein